MINLLSQFVKNKLLSVELYAPSQQCHSQLIVQQWHDTAVFWPLEKLENNCLPFIGFYISLLNKLLEHGKVLVPKKFEYHCVPV
jgi:hypothetical protein